MSKHYFRGVDKKREISLRSKISEVLMSTQTNIEVIEKRVTKFEQRLEEILNRLDELESRLAKLEQLLE